MAPPIKCMCTPMETIVLIRINTDDSKCKVVFSTEDLSMTSYLIFMLIEIIEFLFMYAKRFSVAY